MLAHLNTYSDILMYKWEKPYSGLEMSPLCKQFFSCKGKKEHTVIVCVSDCAPSLPPVSYNIALFHFEFTLILISFFQKSKSMRRIRGTGRAGMFLISCCSLKPSAAQPQSPAHLSWILWKQKVSLSQSLRFSVKQKLYPTFQANIP